MSENDWWRLLRKTFEVPGIISDENSETAIAYALRHGFDEPPLDVDDARSVVREVVRVGGKGDLDELFMVGHDRADKKSLVNRVTRPVLESAPDSGPTAPDRSADRFDALVEAVLRKVSEQVTAHPYED
jgi:hypothetical protein